MTNPPTEPRDPADVGDMTTPDRTPRHPCQRVCEYAVDIGLPEYSGIENDDICGNCDHYNTPAPTPTIEETK